MEKVIRAANLYIAVQKAIVLIHQNAHWLAEGDSSYGDHLLFERTYETAQKGLDASAEKMIGLFGKEALDFSTQNVLLGRALSYYKELEGDPATMCLSVEKSFLKLSQELYDLFEQEDVLTLGLDDFLMSNASDHEENVYLLQQKLK